MQRDHNGYNYHTFKVKMYFSLIRILKSKEKKLAITSFFFSVKEHDWMIHKNLFT